MASILDKNNLGNNHRRFNMGAFTLKVYCEYTPRGKHGGALCSPLKFIGECTGPAIKEGHYKVWDGSCTYCVPVSEMNEVDDE